MISLLFDRSNYFWEEDEAYNLAFIRLTAKHLNDLLSARGYLYLNDIYENFGMAWNPEWENKVIKYNTEDDTRIQLKATPINNEDIKIELLI